MLAAGFPVVAPEGGRAGCSGGAAWAGGGERATGTLTVSSAEACSVPGLVAAVAATTDAVSWFLLETAPPFAPAPAWTPPPFQVP